MNNNKFVYDKCDMHKNMICIKKNKEINNDTKTCK